MEQLLKIQGNLSIEYNRQKKERKYLKQKAEKERWKQRVKQENSVKSGQII